MGSSLLFYEDFLKPILIQPDMKEMSIPPGPADVWQNQPTLKGIILYSIVTPIVCAFGICANTLSLMVLNRKELLGSVYTYLTVLAAVDLMMSFILLFGGLSRGVLYYSACAIYDALVGLPLTGVLNSVSVIATVAVTIDRVLFLWNPAKCTKPRFCNPRLARKIMVGSIFLAIILNLPYCFIFSHDGDGNISTTQFFRSRFYCAYNWFMLIIFSIVPAIILIIGNSFLIMSLQKARKIGIRCHGKRRDHTNLTVTLISITVLFLVTEIPSALLSRTKTVILLFGGDQNKANTRGLEITRQVWTLLGAFNITMNFIFYCLFCPAFVKALRKILRKNKTRKNVEVNVFLVGNTHCPKQPIAKAQIQITKNEDSNYPSSLFKKYENSGTKSDTIHPTDEGDYVRIIRNCNSGGYDSIKNVKGESIKY